MVSSFEKHSGFWAMDVYRILLSFHSERERELSKTFAALKNILDFGL
jgi:hypothetical protein